jgi:DNA polymerase delta subunit 4
MPPKTRHRAAPPAQTTLSFKNKVTKTTQQQQESKKRLSDTVKDEIIEHVSTPEPQTQPEPVHIEPEVEAPAPSSPITTQPKKKKRASGASTSVDSREAAAEKITDAQIKSYWRKEEESRLAPRGMSPQPHPLPHLRRSPLLVPTD